MSPRSFCGQRRQIHPHTWQINVAARPQRSGRNHFATNPVLPFLQHEEMNDAVINQNGVAFVDVVDQSIVVHIHRVGFLALGAADGEFENVAGFQMQFRLEIAGANGRPLRVHENGHGAAKFLRDGADSRDDLTHPIMLRMTHVEPENIGAFVDQLPQRFRFLARRSERANDFRSAH